MKKEGRQMACPDRGRLERIDFYQGQLLKARDLQDAADRTSRLGGLHVAAVHGTWGVALGYGVSVSKRTLTLQPGIAYDCQGRRIVLSTQARIPLPEPEEGTQWYDLTIRYQSDMVAEGGRRSPCLGERRSPYEERPGWRWHLAGSWAADERPPLASSLKLGLEIPLARIAVASEGERHAGPDFSYRRHARGLVHPHVASGTIEAEKAWDGAAAVLLEVDVDTSEAGFTDTPYYFAQLTQNPWVDLDNPTQAAKAPILGPFITISDPREKRFTLEVRMVIMPGEQAPEPMDMTIRGNWLGVEPTGGCPPAPRDVFWVVLQQGFYLTPVRFGTMVPMEPIL